MEVSYCSHPSALMGRLRARIYRPGVGVLERTEWESRTERLDRVGQTGAEKDHVLYTASRLQGGRQGTLS